MQNMAENIKPSAQNHNQKKSKTKRQNPLETIDVQQLLQTQINSVKITDEIIRKNQINNKNRVKEVEQIKNKHDDIMQQLKSLELDKGLKQRKLE